MRAFVVVNPVAGGGRTARRWPGLRERLARRGVEVEAAETTAPGDATALARQAARNGWPVIVAVGGDGTVNEVVNGLVEAGAPSAPALAILLTGRARDVARNLGVDASPEAAVARLVAGGERRVDLGVVEWPDGRRRVFVNAAGAGFDAAVAAQARHRGGSGTLPYLAGVLATLRAYRPVDATIALDGADGWRGPITTAVVANGPAYGGGMRIAPAADPADGWLDLVVVGGLGRLELLRWLPTVYRGAHLAHPRVTARRVRRLALEAAAPLPLHVDGEPVDGPPVRIGILPAALRLRG